MSGRMAVYAGRYAVGGRRYKAARRIGKFIYKNRNHLKRGAQTYMRGRKSKMARRMEPGKRNFSSAVQQDIANTDTQIPLVMGRLYISSPDYPLHSSGNLVASRETNRMYLKGIKLCRQFYRTNGGGKNLPQMKFNYALVQLKCPLSPEGTNSDTEGAAEALAKIKEKFWRINTFTGTRSVDFNQYVPGQPWTNIYNCQPMNPNGNFNILSKYSKTLTTRANSISGGHAWYWQLDKYIKVGKKMVFDSLPAVYPQNPIFEIWWYNQVNPLDYDQNNIDSIQAETFANHTTYFSEPK